MDQMKYAFFPGCLIQTRFPRFEILAKQVLPFMGIELVEMEDFSCCPDPVRFRAVDQFAWLAMAARNLSIAQKEGLAIITLCPGCTLTLAQANREMQERHLLSRKVNEVLRLVGHSLDGPVMVKHFLKVLHEDVGFERIQRTIKRPLKGMRIAAHDGCHQSLPPDIMNFGNPFNPRKLDELLEALGIEPVDYREKSLCCGSPLTLSGALDDSLSVVKRKVEDMKRFGAEALAVGCAACFLQFETGQVTAFRKLLTDVQLPVFHYLELLALAMGMNLEDIGFKEHKIRGEEKVLLERFGKK